VYLRLAILAAIVLALAATHWKAYTAGAKNVRNEWQIAISAANEQARETERLRQKAVDAAVSASAIRESRIRADAVRARGSDDGLRDDLAAFNARRTSCAAEADRTAAITELLRESVTAYRELAATCDRHVNDIRTLLDAWPK
jgi:hypothetical protein